jgi:hypothetical protein
MLNNWKCVADISVVPANTPCQKETWDHEEDDPLANPFSRHNLTQCTLSIVRPQNSIAGDFAVNDSSFVFDIEAVNDAGCFSWRFKDYLGCGSFGLSDWRDGLCELGPLGFSYLNTRANPAVMLEAHGHIQFLYNFNTMYNHFAPSIRIYYHCISGNKCEDWIDWYYGDSYSHVGNFDFPVFQYCGPEYGFWGPNYLNFNNQNPLTWQGVFANPDHFAVNQEGASFRRIGLALEVTYS